MPLIERPHLQLQQRVLNLSDSTRPELPLSIVSIPLGRPNPHSFSPNNENKDKSKDHSPNHRDGDDHVRDPNSIDPWRQCEHHDGSDDVASESDTDKCVANNLVNVSIDNGRLEEFGVI